MGFFITFEGIEGTGKSTQMNLLGDYLKKKGRDVLAVREPGGTRVGEKIRAVLLNSDSLGIDPWAELFLYEACRAELVKEVIAPALKAGKTVVSDRFVDSTVAYQGYGRGLDVKTIEGMNRQATRDITPDITFLIDIAPEDGLKRAFKRINNARGPKDDRFEKEDIAFHRRVRQGYLEIAVKDPGRVRVIDGGREISLIHKEICDIIDKAVS